MEGELTAGRVGQAITRTIVWSDIMNTTLIFESCRLDDPTVRIDDVCKAFRNFEVLGKITVTDSVTSQLTSVFHQKVHVSKTIALEKYQAFMRLFSKDDSNDETSPCGISERDMIVTILKSNFTLSQNESEKMKSSELVDRVCRLLPEGSADVRHRIPGYLREAGLNKKRQADGNYYFGISFIKSKSSLLVSTDSTDKLMFLQNAREESTKLMVAGSTSCHAGLAKYHTVYQSDR